MREFIKDSYSYINPNGVLEHVWFVLRLPVAGFKFYTLMRNYEKNNRNNPNG